MIVADAPSNWIALSFHLSVVDAAFNEKDLSC